MKNKIIEIKSRYGEPRYLEVMCENIYHVYGGEVEDVMYVNINENGDYTKMDFRGGPYFEVGGKGDLYKFGIEDKIVQSIRNITIEDKPNRIELIVK